MKQIINVFKIHARNKFIWFILPWLILLTSLLINLFISLLLGGTTPIYTGGVGSIYVFLFILGLLTVRDTFPFALGFGVRRTDYVLGTILILLAASLASAVLLLLFSLIENGPAANWGVNVHFFHLPYLSDGTPIEQFWVFFTPLVNLYLLAFALSSIQRRFGQSGMWIFFGVACLLISCFTLLSTALHWWGQIGAWLGQFTAFDLASWAFLLAVVYALISYALLRRATA